MDGVVGVEGEGLVGEGSKTKMYRLQCDVSWDISAYTYTLQIGARTPFTILVPTLVTVPLTISLRGVLSTSVLPGSMGASSA
jgi:hypothetical protein